MTLPFGKPGVFRFLFVALLLVFNWPLLSIPAPEDLFGWLFTAWALAIVLLFLAMRGAGGANAASAGPVGPAGPAGPTGPGAGTGREGGGV